MRAVIYLRYSSDKQRKSFSIEEQRDACVQKAKSDGAVIVREFIDKAESAKTINRPDLVEMISFVMSTANDIDVVYVLDTSRFSRESIGFKVVKQKLSQKGVLVSVVMGMDNSSLEGDLVQDLIARIQEFDNQLKGVKTKGGMRQRYLAGYALRTVRGYKMAINDDGKKELVPDESFAAYQALWNKIRDEKMSVSSALKYHNKLHPSFKLTKSSIARMLENKLYYGILSYPKYDNQEVKGKHVPMIDEDTFYQVRAIINGRSHKNTKIRNKINPLYPLTKSLYCHVCGTKTTAARSKGKNKHYEYYFCRKRGKCKYNVQVQKVHEAFREKLKELIPTDEMMLFIREMVTEKYESYFDSLNHSSRDIEHELKDLEEKKHTLLEKLLEGTISNEVYKSTEARMESEITVRKILIAEKRSEKIDIETVLNFIFYYMKNIDKIWERYPIETKIALQCSTFPKGVYFENGACRTPEISFAFKTKELVEALSDPNSTYVEHLDNLIEDYKRIYNTMRPFISVSQDFQVYGGSL